MASASRAANEMGEYVRELESERDRLRAALEDIAGHFCPGDERRTYSSDIPGVMDRIRAVAREATDA